MTTRTGRWVQGVSYAVTYALVNYFAHAWIASRVRPEPRFVLGAMLPDLAGFLRIRLPPQSDREVSAGIALHHATDAVFHQLPAFRERNRAGIQALRGLGLGRGPARAAAHVGIELALDALLAARCATTREHYLGALRGYSGMAIEVGDTAKSRAVKAMALRLGQSESGPSGDASQLSERVRRTLAPRPSLALNPRDVAPLTAWLDHTCAELAPRGEDIARETLLAVRTRQQEV